MSNIDNFPTPLLFPLKFVGVSFGVDPVMLESAESEMIRLINGEIIFAEFANSRQILLRDDDINDVISPGSTIREDRHREHADIPN